MEPDRSAQVVIVAIDPVAPATVHHQDNSRSDVQFPRPVVEPKAMLVALDMGDDGVADVHDEPVDIVLNRVEPQPGASPAGDVRADVE